MTATTQIICLLFSFFYGLFFFFTWGINSLIIKTKKRRYRSLISILFMCNIVLIYLIILYKINFGAFHIYFLFMIILGFLTGIKIRKLLSNNVKLQIFIAKVKKKCYTEKEK